MQLDENQNVADMKSEVAVTKNAAQKRSTKTKSTRATVATAKTRSSKRVKKTTSQWTFEPEEILGASDRYDGKIKFNIKVKGSDRCEIVPAEEAHIQCPQLVIAFYEKHLVFDRF